MARFNLGGENEEAVEYVPNAAAVNATGPYPVCCRDCGSDSLAPDRGLFAMMNATCNVCRMHESVWFCKLNGRYGCQYAICAECYNHKRWNEANVP